MLRRSTALGEPKRRMTMALDPVFISPRKRLSTDFMYKGEGKLNSGFKQPYRIWAWKQRELFRNVQEAQFEHMRRVYKRQWFEAYRVNASEYIYKYNTIKAAQMVQWEHEMEAQEMKRREAYQSSAGRQALRAKHLDLLREYHEKNFFAWYERASERLQYMAQTMKFVDKDKLDAHIDAELDKYVFEPNRSYPLNFAGQMPMLEDRDGQIVAAASHAFTRAAQHELPGLQEYIAPKMSPDEANALAESISGNLRGVMAPGDAAAAGGDAAGAATEDDLVADELQAQVADVMAEEHMKSIDDAHGGGEQREDVVGNLDDETYQQRRRMYLDRGKSASAKRAQLFTAKKPGRVQSSQLETIQDTDTTVVAAGERARAAEMEIKHDESKRLRKKRDKRDGQREKMMSALADLEKADESQLTKNQRYQQAMARNRTKDAELEAAVRSAQQAATTSDGNVKPKITEELLDLLMKKQMPSARGAEAASLKKSKGRDDQQ